MCQRDRHRATVSGRPDEPSSFQYFREQAGPLAIMPDQFYQIAAFAAEAKQMTAQRVMLQNLLHLKG